MSLKNDLTGRRYGDLVVIKPTKERKAGYIMWLCRCDCGNEILMESRRLKRGSVLDCGCKVRAEAERKKSPAGATRFSTEDWIGKKYGQLTVLSYAGKKNRCHNWLCRCDCGKEIEVRGSNLKNGHTKSCGCKFSPADTRHFVNGTCIEMISSKKVFKNNSSGVRGVYWNKRDQKWVAQITFQGKTRRLGSFEKIGDAEKARLEAEKELFHPILENYQAKKENEDL